MNSPRATNLNNNVSHPPIAMKESQSVILPSDNQVTRDNYQKELWNRFMEWMLLPCPLWFVVSLTWIFIYSSWSILVRVVELEKKLESMS